jgi:hypothetical protein
MKGKKKRERDGGIAGREHILLPQRTRQIWSSPARSWVLSPGPKLQKGYWLARMHGCTRKLSLPMKTHN